MSEIAVKTDNTPDRIDLPFTVLNVSYSKAQAFRTCKFKFQQAHVRPHSPTAKKPGLMPKKKGKALARGTLGHAIMERFLKRVKDQLEFPYDPAKCKEFISDAVAWGYGEDYELVAEIATQCLHFGSNVFPYKGWRILEIEKEYRISVGTHPVTGVTLVVPMTIDLIVEINGEIVVIDHKFSADAYSDQRCEIEPQLPIYIGVLRAHKIPAKYGIYNFMRTRKMKNVEEQVVQKPCKPNNHRVKQSFKEHLDTTKDIHEFQSLGLMPTRNPNNNCDYCDFAKLCAVDLRGDDTTLMAQVDFEANDYGYEE